MTTFRCLMEVTTLMELDVKADNKKQAQEIANQTDINDWTSVEDTNIDLISIYEVENVNI